MSNMKKNTNKLLKMCVPISVKDAHEGEEEGGIHVTGFASTNDEDRDGDIIASDAWSKSSALSNYLKNPVILAYHDMSRPIGKMTNHEVSDLGFKITAKISKAAGDIIDLIKDGILSAFSVGFMIKDADFDAKSGVFMVKELELYEVSVVSVPANQNALFNIEKNFSDSEEYMEFKKQFIKQDEEILMKEEPTKGSNESPVDVAALAKQIRDLVKSDLDSEKKAKEEADQKAATEAAKIEATATTAAERLIKDLREELVQKDSELSEALNGIRDALKKEATEMEKVFEAENKGKMKYMKDGETPFSDLSINKKDGMLFASKILGLGSVENTKAFKELVQKSGMEHWASGADVQWEEEYSTRIFDAMRENLVMEPIFTTIPMTTPTINMPINPEAGDATWVNDAAFRSSRNQADETGDGTNTSTGEAQNHQLTQQQLNAYKLATREYVGYEEEEDSIVALAPVIRDAVSRRMALSSDRALLRGAGILVNDATYDPITGLELLGGSTTDVAVTGGAAWATNFTEDNIVDMRRNLSIYGLDPTQLVLLCSHDLYYEIMKLQNFKTVDVLGNRATILTGEVGQLFGIRVVVSQQFDNAAIAAGTVGTTLAILARPSNFVVGNLRGLLTESFQDVINQKRGLVSSRRFGFQSVIAGQATVNLEIAS